MDLNLSKIIERYAEGDVGGARRSLVDLLVADPSQEDAWRMLEIMFPDANIQVECYREILARAPESRRAADKLQVIKTKQDSFGQAGERVDFGDELPFYSRNRQARQHFLSSPREVFSLVGERPDPSELRKCPNPRCGASIPKDAAKCQWCGEVLMKE